MATRKKLRYGDEALATGNILALCMSDSSLLVTLLRTLFWAALHAWWHVAVKILFQHSEKSDVVERLTDPAGYTGTQRFSADGKAVEGKKELADQSQVNTDGYVSGYKNAETYDKDHSVTVSLEIIESDQSLISVMSPASHVSQGAAT